MDCFCILCNKLLIQKKSLSEALLLSLIPPSCMIAPNRELVNILFSFITSTHSNPLKQYNIKMNIEINTSRNRSANTSFHKLSCARKL